MIYYRYYSQGRCLRKKVISIKKISDEALSKILKKSHEKAQFENMNRIEKEKKAVIDYHCMKSRDDDYICHFTRENRFRRKEMVS